MSRVVYPDCPSALRFVTHSHENIPIPTPPSVSKRDNDSSSAQSLDFSQTSKSSASNASMLSDEELNSSQTADVPQLLNQNDLNDLVRDLSLTNEKSKLFSSTLKQLNMLQKGVDCTYFCFKHLSLQDFFSVRNNVCYCRNIDGLFEALESEHHSIKWGLFIESSKASLKAVLLNNRNKKPFIPLVHAIALKESHETMELILRLTNYSASNWNICGGLKAIGFLLGMQMGYTKHQCFFWTPATMSNIISKILAFSNRKF